MVPSTACRSTSGPLFPPQWQLDPLKAICPQGNPWIRSQLILGWDATRSPLGSQTGALGPGQCDFRRCDPVADSSELTTGGGGTCPDCLVKTPACGPIMTRKKTYGPEMERSPTVWKLAGRKLLASSLLQGHKFLPTRRSWFHSDDCCSWKYASQRISGKVDPWQSKHGNNDTDR